MKISIEDHNKFTALYHGVKISLLQGMVDGSASKPVLVQDTGYMVGKTYPDIAPYLGAFGALYKKDR